jgi:hypothetical protein
VELLSLINDLPREHWITVILVVVMAPWVVRWWPWAWLWAWSLVNISMSKPAAQFLNTIEQHSAQQGFSAPQDLQWYLALMMANHLQDTHMVPDISFAERYLTMLQSPDPQALQRFADQILLAISVMPALGLRRGIHRVYYQHLGSTAYLHWGMRCRDIRGQQLCAWFPYLNEFLITLFGNQRGSLSLFDPWADK